LQYYKKINCNIFKLQDGLKKLLFFLPVYAKKNLICWISTCPNLFKGNNKNNYANDIITYKIYYLVVVAIIGCLLFVESCVCMILETHDLQYNAKIVCVWSLKMLKMWDRDILNMLSTHTQTLASL